MGFGDCWLIWVSVEIFGGYVAHWVDLGSVVVFVRSLETNGFFPRPFGLQGFFTGNQWAICLEYFKVERLGYWAFV